MRFYAVCCSAAFFMTVPASAEFYAGLEGQHCLAAWESDGEEHADYTDGVALRLGYRFKHFALEMGGETTEAEYGNVDKNGLNSVNRLTIKAATGDIYLYFPLEERDWLQPFLTFGASWTVGKARTHVENDGSITSLFSNSDVLWRAGIGSDIRLFRDVALRITARYQPYDFGGRAKRGASFNIGFFTAL